MVRVVRIIIGMDRLAIVREIFRDTGTDKLQHGYAVVYQHVPLNIESLLEIGVGGGHSLRAWDKLFPSSRIVALDHNEPRTDVPERVIQVLTDVTSINWIDDYPDLNQSFDLIVDDASHDKDQIIKAWDLFYPKCTGLYVIEDLTSDSWYSVMQHVMQKSSIVSLINTGKGGDDRCIVASFGRVIVW